MKQTKTLFSILTLLLVFLLSNGTIADPTSCNLTGFVTYTQGGWGSKPNSTPGGIRQAHFSTVFPNGLVVGIGKTLTLTTSDAVQAFLPGGGNSGAFNTNYINPTKGNTSAGILAGQLVALTLNVKFDEAGKIGTNAINLGDLVFKSGTFAGMTVKQFLLLANKAIGGSGTSGYSFSDFNDAATLINENFDEGTTNKNKLTCPEPLFFSLGDFVWFDANKNGIQDAGESGITGVTVKLYTSGNSLIATTTTDATGYYTFTNLSAANYYVQVTAPAGYTITTKDAGSDDTKDSDVDPSTGKTDVFNFANTADDLTRDAGMFLTNASVGDKVWNDVDKDGIQDENELGIPNVTVKLYTCESVLVGTTTTNSNGIYTFTDLTPGSYYVKYTTPAGYTITLQDVGDDTKDSDINNFGRTACFTLTPGQNDNTRDAGYYVSPASVGDKVWNDTNKNGIQDAGENAIPSVEVKLYSCNNAFIATTITDANGNYLFSGLTPGEYYVLFTAPAGYTISPKDAGENDDADSDVEPSNGKTACFILGAGQNDLSWDAGMYLTPGSIGDYVWNDANKDGIQDNNETGIQGVTVDLYNCADVFQASTTTDANGLYKFENLSAGTYYVKFILPADYTFTLTNSGSNDNVDSDADGTTGKTPCATLAQGEQNITLDAGMYLANVSADLRLTKTSSVTEPNDNESVTFTVTVFNDGPSTATGISVNDVLPLGLVYNSSTVSQGTYDNLTGLWTVGTLASGANAVLTVTATTSLAALNTTTVNLGPATGWNAFILEDLTQPSSDTEGKLAVGRDANLAQYSVGDKLPNSNGTVDVLIVGRDLTFTTGRVYHGNVVYGNSTNLPLTSVSVDEGTIRQEYPIDFAAAQTYLSTLSVGLSNYSETDTTSFQWGTLDLVGDDPYLNVFNVDGAELSVAHTVNVNVPNGASVLVNISGTSVNWTGGLWILGTAINNVLYNFYEATNIHLVSIDVRGTVLAPFAHVDFPTGLVSGQMIAKSLTGRGQFNNVMFNGNIPGTRTITNIAEVASSNQPDPDSNPGNGVTTEDDYASASLTIKFNTSATPAGNWTYVGEFLPGEIVSFITSDVNGNLVSGTHWGKVYLSTNGGTNWTIINPNNTFGTVWSIAARNNAIYVATSHGAFKTVDQGANWIETGLDTSKDVRTIAIDANGNLYAGVWGSGVLKSTDGGTTWFSVNNGINNIAIGAVTIHATTGDIYVGTFGDQMFKSTDGGATWSHIEVGYAWIWSVAVLDDGTIFAGTYGGGVFVSRDQGFTFQQMNTGLNNAFIYAITVDLAGNVFINSWSGGVYALPAGTLSWTNMGMAGYGVSSIFINPTNTESNPVIYVGTSEGKIFKNSDGVASTENNSSVPTEFSLSQNYPNPFNPSTTIQFSLKMTERVNLTIFNILGEEVRTLINADMTAGKHTVNFDAKGLNSGIYFYRITTPTQSVTKKMMLIK